MSTILPNSLFAQVITQDIVLTEDSVLPDNCVLIFQGGKFVTAPNVESVTLDGRGASIVAGFNPIFGEGVTPAGLWSVCKSYPEWFEDSDDLVKLNNAAKLLYNYDNSTNKGTGGELFLSRTYLISSPFVVPRFITIVGKNTENAVIKAQDDFAPSAAEPTIRSVVFFKNLQETSINKSIGCRNFKIDCNVQACHGVEMQDPYDCVILENIQVINVSPEYNAFRLYKLYQNVGQTIILVNCLGYKYKYEKVGNTVLTPEQSLERLLPSTPVFYLRGIHETSLIGCKAFGGLRSFSGSNVGNQVLSYKQKVKEIATNIKRQELNNYSEDIVAQYDEISSYVGNTGFYYEDCRGIVMDGCSSGKVLTAIEIASVGKATIGFTISGQTNEWVYLHDIYTRGNTAVHLYYTVNNITLLPLRRQNSYGTALLKYCSDSNMWFTNRTIGVIHYAGNGNTFYSVYPLNTKVDEQIGDITTDLPVLPKSSANILFPPAYMQADNGFRVSKELFVMGEDDTSHIINTNHNYDSISLDVNDNKGRIKRNKKQRIVVSDDSTKLYDNDGSTKILEAKKTTQNNNTGLSVWVKEGDDTRCAQVRLATPSSDGTRQLIIDGTASVYPSSGITAQAPKTGVVAGHCFFFTNLGNKPGWFDGEFYRDATGTIII